MAHVGGIGQIVGAEESREELIEEGSFVAGAAGGIEDGFVRMIQRIEVPGDSFKGLGPGDRMIMRILFSLDHRTGEAALLTQPVVRLLGQFLNRIVLEKFVGDDAGGGFMGDGLDAVFTKLRDGPVAVGVGPAAAGAIKPLLLIDLEKRLTASPQAHFMRDVFEGGQDGGDAPGPRGGFVNIQVTGIVERDFPRRW